MNHLAWSLVCLMLVSGLAAFQMEKIWSSRQAEASCCAQVKTKCAQSCIGKPAGTQCSSRCANSQCGPYKCGDQSSTTGEDACCSEVKTKCINSCSGHCDQQCGARCGQNSQCGPYACSSIAPTCSGAPPTPAPTPAPIPAPTPPATCLTEKVLCKVGTTTIAPCCGSMMCFTDPMHPDNGICTAPAVALDHCLPENTICRVGITTIQSCCGKMPCLKDAKNSNNGICTAVACQKPGNALCEKDGKSVGDPCCPGSTCYPWVGSNGTPGNGYCQLDACINTGDSCNKRKGRCCSGKGCTKGTGTCPA